MKTLKSANRRLGMAMVILSSTVFGIVPLLMIRCYALGANSTTFLIVRSLIVLLVLMPASGLHKHPLELWKSSWPTVLFLSFTSTATTLLLFEAYKYIPTGLVTTIHFMYPTVVTVICLLFFHEAATKQKMICVALCFIGVLLLGGQGGELRVEGILMAAISSLTYSLYIIGADRLPLGNLTELQLMFSLELCNLFLVACLYGPVTGMVHVELPLSGWLQLALFAAIHGLLGQLMFLFGVRRIKAQLASIASTLEPITSILMGFLFLQESISLPMLTGSALILASIAISAQKESPEKRRAGR